MFRSTPSDLFERTSRGGLFTIALLLVAEMLAISEFMWFWTTSYKETVAVGSIFSENMDLFLDMTIQVVPCDQLQITLWDKYQDKAISITGSTFHMTRVIDGDLAEKLKDIDPHSHDANFLAESIFMHPELERDWDKVDPNFNEHTFDAQTDAHDLTMFFFYADWCPHSRASHPHWKKAVTNIDERDVKDADGNVLKLAMIQINCVVYETLCWEKDITDYPTFRIYHRDGKFIEYEGERETDPIINFVVTSASNTHHQKYWVPERPTEGCHLKGMLRIPRVPGHLQFSKFGKGHSVGWADLTHSITAYSFIDPLDDLTVGSTGLETNPLDGKSFNSSDKKTAFAHYATLVQTTVDRPGFLTSDIRPIYQMSVLSVQNSLNDHHHLGIKFAHDMFPMAVKYEREKKSTLHFLIRMFAILGGLYTIFNILHSATKLKST